MPVLRLEEILKEKGIGITELAERLKINRQTVYYYIKQDDKNPLSQLQKIADALGVSLIDLFKEGEEVNGYLKVSGMIYEINSFTDLENVLKLKKAE